MGRTPGEQGETTCVARSEEPPSVGAVARVRRLGGALGLCALWVAVGCAKQDQHFIQVVQPPGEEFTAAECDMVTRLVDSIAKDYDLQEVQGNAVRDSFPRYRGYWSESSPVSFRMHCDARVLLVDVTAVRKDDRDGTYHDAVGALSAGIEDLFMQEVVQWRESRFAGW